MRLVIVSLQQDIDPARRASARRPGRLHPLRRLGARRSQRVGFVGGVQVHVDNVRRFFEDAGHEVVVVTPFDVPWPLTLAAAAITKALRRARPVASERWRRFWLAELIRLALSRARRQVLTPGDPVCFYTQCPTTARAAFRVRGAGSSVVLALHSSGSEADELVLRGICDEHTRLYVHLARLEQRVVPAVDGLVMMSQSAANQVLRRVPAARALPCAVVPNFLGGEWDDPVPERPRERRDLISVGALIPLKNHRYLLQVLAEARRLGHEYTLSIVGIGPEAQALRELCRQLSLEGQVAFLGTRLDMPALLEAHRAYVHTAVAETFGIAILEAMAKGLPVVAGAVGGIPEVFRDGVEGRYLPLDAVTDAAEVVIALLENPADLERCGAAARQRFEAEFSDHVAGPRLEAFLADAVDSAVTATRQTDARGDGYEN